MTKPAKDEAELVARITGALWNYQGAHHADITLAAIRAAGWAVVPQAELEILCTENARQRGALNEIAANAANPGHAQEQCKAIWRMARVMFAGKAEP